jgi:anti-anti-sigma regulatory factor
MASKLDYKLPENLTIANVNSVHEELEALMGKQECDEIVLKADKVKRADTAGLQLILAFVNAAHASHIELVWNKPSQDLCDAATILGLASALGLATA